MPFGLEISNAFPMSFRANFFFVFSPRNFLVPVSQKALCVPLLLCPEFLGNVLFEFLFSPAKRTKEDIVLVTQRGLTHSIRHKIGASGERDSDESVDEEFAWVGGTGEQLT